MIPGDGQNDKRQEFFIKEGIMSVLRYWAPFLFTLIGLYCVIWGIVASSVPTAERPGAAFFGLLWLLLAFVYVRVILLHEQEEITRSNRTV